MIGFLRYSQFPGLVSGQTKPYQDRWLQGTLSAFVTPKSRIADIGGNTNFATLLRLEATEKWVIDPYDGLDGGGANHIPTPPASIHILQCTIGPGSAVLADDYFDLLFSSSVLEHIGQKAVNYDCLPARNPPPEQEQPRDEFCRECFRVLRPGGVTIHTIDHAPRNLTWDANFRRAGFRPLDAAARRPSVEELLQASDAVRQQVSWTNSAEDLPQKELHSVLYLGYVKSVPAPGSAASARRPIGWRFFRRLRPSTWLSRRVTPEM